MIRSASLCARTRPRAWSWRSYVTKARLETGARMLRDTGLRVGDVSNLLGYSDRMVFSDAFLRWTGMRPKEFRRRCRATAAEGRAGEELHCLAFLEDLRQGRLDSRRAARLLAALEAVAPAADPMAGESASPPVRAECLAGWIWDLVEGLPSTERRHWARHVIRVDSPAFFHLLGEKIREQVRRDPRACLELARLALEHLEANAQALGEEAPALRALGRAWLGNAQRLAWDFAGGHQTFRRAREQWLAAGGAAIGGGGDSGIRGPRTRPRDRVGAAAPGDPRRCGDLADPTAITGAADGEPVRPVDRARLRRDALAPVRNRRAVGRAGASACPRRAPPAAAR